MDRKPSLLDLSSDEVVAEYIHRSGITTRAVADCARLVALCSKQLLSSGVEADQRPIVLWIPGRIEVLGKHTDYAGGRSLLVAADRGICFVAVPRRDASLRIWDPIRKTSIEFEIGPELQPGPHWVNYAMTAARRISRNFGPELCGADIAFGGNLPSAAGMSSSSALVVGFSLVLIEVNHLDRTEQYRAEISDRESLAAYLGTVENGQSFGVLAGDKGVGTFGGSEDHTAILCCQSGTLSQYSFCPVQFERRIPLSGELVFVVGVSGVVSDKTGDSLEKYNRVSKVAGAVVAIWNRESGKNDAHMAEALRSSLGRVEEIEALLLQGADHPRELIDRVRQFSEESERIIPEAGDALLHGDLDRFGGLVARSQQLAETHLRNQVEETVFLASSALERGAIAASAFGAGFGGSVWALVERDHSREFLEQWSRVYLDRFAHVEERADFFLTEPGTAACRLV